jgi:tetratricopeptide (TPR) repeat protein
MHKPIPEANLLSKKKGADLPPQNILFEKEIDEAIKLHRLGSLEEAAKAYQLILNTHPRNAYVLFLLGTVFNQQKDYQRSRIVLTQAHEIDPKSAGTLTALGISLRRLNLTKEAIILFQTAIQYQPNFHDAHYNLGNLFKDLGDYQQAKVCYDAAIEIKNDFTHSHINLGFIYEELGSLDLALVSYQHVIQLNPGYVEAYINIGNVLQKLHFYSEALSVYNQAIQIDRSFYQVWANRGLVLKELNLLNDSLSSFKNALELNPDNMEIINNISNIFKYLGQLDDAHRMLEQGLKNDPSNPKLHWNLSILYLLQGNFERGFQEYEWRWKDEEVSIISGKRDFKEPLWLGDQLLSGKTILLYTEQGLGDTIQFGRYVPLFAQLDCKVILEIQAPLLPLFQEVSGIHQLVVRGNPLPAFDYQCPIMSLPLAFGTRLETIPPIQPIILDAEKLTEWQSRLGSKNKPRVGLVWSGGTTHKDDRRRSIQLKDYLGHCTDDFEYFSLQKEIREKDTQDLQNSSVRHFADDLHDFADTASLISQMDLVISVDTSVAHLAASLGKPTLILIPYAPDWRWMLDRDDSPWYPTVKLYRQTTLGDWQPTLQNLFKDLADIKPMLLNNMLLS